MSSVSSSTHYYIARDPIHTPPNRTIMAEMPISLSNHRRTRQQPPQDIIDEFWTKFTTKTPGKATTIIPQNAYAENAARRSAKATGTTTQASYEEAAAVCKVKVEKIVKECRRVNQRYRDPHFDLEFDMKFGRRDCLESLWNIKDQDQPQSLFNPKGVKRVVDIFDSPQFYIDGPTANDVRQGRDGDCWLMAALCNLSNKPGLIEKVCVAHDQDVGVYGFVFHRDGEWFSEIIDDKLYLTKPDYDEGFLERILWEDRERVNSEEAYRKIYQSNSGALYFAQCENPNETWLPLLEKAYAKAHGDYAAIEGGFTGEAIEDLTGGVTSEIYTTDILDKEYFWKENLLKVNEDCLLGCSTGFPSRGWGERKGIIEMHAYSVMKAVEIDKKRLVLLKNPWGKGEWKGAWSDGSKEWTPDWLQKLDHKFGDDGAFWISYQDLLKKYNIFDLTRLFGSEWKITSIWTTLTVPWTLDYHDTYFAFSISKPGPVVLVLAQLDDRYFHGLEGQYRFELGLRLHKAGQEDYVVRSQASYRMNRSVNVELDLEAGDYEVLVKIDAVRNNKVLPVEQVIRNNAKVRREKLIRIGLAYDLAHSKGKIIESAEEKAAREAHEKRKKEKERMEMKKKIIEEREELHYLKIKDQKKQLARRAKFDAKRKAKAEKRKAAGKSEERTGQRSRIHIREFREVGRSPVPKIALHKNNPPKARSGKHVQIRDPISPRDDSGEAKGCDSITDRGDKTPSATNSDKSGLSDMPKPDVTVTEVEVKPSKVDKPAVEQASVSTESQPSETTEKADLGEDKLPDTEQGVIKLNQESGTNGKEPSKSTESNGKAVSPTKEHTASNANGASQDEDEESQNGELESERSEPPEFSDLGECESESDDEQSLSSLSELSERELDIRIERQQHIPRIGPPLPQARGMLEDQDEFEKDPWNAVAVVGLRVYYKVSEEDKDRQIVKLRVVRPDPYADEADTSSTDNEQGEKKKPKGLDVDDSAKDATLEGEVKQRTKSIVPDSEG